MIGPPGTFATPARTSGSRPRSCDAVDAAERLAGVVDPRRRESGAPSPSTSIPALISFTSCIRSTTVWRRPSRLETSAVRPTAFDAFGRVDRAVAVLVDSRGRRPGTSTAGERRAATCTSERPAAVADDVDRDRGDPGPAERGRDGPGRAVLRVREAVAEDRHRPAAGGLGAGRDEERELDEVRRPAAAGVPVVVPTAGITFVGVS